MLTEAQSKQSHNSLEHYNYEGERTVENNGDSGFDRNDGCERGGLSGAGLEKRIPFSSIPSSSPPEDGTEWGRANLVRRQDKP